MKPALPILLTLLLPIASLHAVDITAEGTSIVVAPGTADVAGQKVTVSTRTVLPWQPVELLSVTDEALKLKAEKPENYHTGTGLRATIAGEVNAFGSLVPNTLEVRKTKGGELLKEGEDYLLEPGWGHLGLGPKSKVTADDTVFVSYSYSLLRMDTVQVSAAGVVTLKQGTPHISAPVPPDADAGQTAIAHVWTNYRDSAPKVDQVYPITESAAQSVTASTKGRIPRILAKLKAGQPVTIVCWGDSVTAGGNASKPELRYVDVFAAGLRSRFPQSQIEVKNISAGGSNSRQWLSPEKYPYRGMTGDANPAQIKNVIAAKPDLVTIEFVNDAGLSPEATASTYDEIMERLKPTGAEIILITPHFTMWSMMKFTDMRSREGRPYVLSLRDYAQKHNLGLADASARWEHLWKEGLPYLTLLHNTINHPDDRGHRLFAEELWKCFE